jgi:ketosteroid isomerase-like protein
MSQVSFHPTTQSRFIDQLESAFHAGDPESSRKSCETNNVKRLVEQYQAIARGDFQAAIDVWDDEIDFEMIGPPDLFLSGRWRGKQQAAEAVARNFAALEDQEAEVQTVVAQGDTIVVFAREKGKIRATGKTYDCHWVQFFTFANEKVTRFRSLTDAASFLDAAML